MRVGLGQQEDKDEIFAQCTYGRAGFPITSRASWNSGQALQIEEKKRVLYFKTYVIKFQFINIKISELLACYHPL